MQNKPCATARPAAAFPCASAATEKFGDVGGDAAVEVEQGTSKRLSHRSERQEESYFKSLEAPPLGSWRTWPDSANHYAQRCRLHLP